MIAQSQNALTSLRSSGTIVIADTADFDKIARFKPSEGTTNPSLLLAAAQDPAYQGLLQKVVAHCKTLNLNRSALLSYAVEHLAVLFGVEIYKLTGKVATEVDVAHSFNTKATVDAALRVIDLYAKEGVPKAAVRIKISATWEGIQAARILEQQHNVSVLVTIVFGLVQAIASAESGATCIAPYVGRISDWHKAFPCKASEGKDMGVVVVQNIQNYLRKYGHATQVMAASFRNTQQVKSLAGIDLMTIAPTYLEKLEQETDAVEAQLTKNSAQAADLQEVSYINDESAFRWAFNADACAVEKSADAMRRFGEDTEKLKGLLGELI